MIYDRHNTHAAGKATGMQQTHSLLHTLNGDKADSAVVGFYLTYSNTHTATPFLCMPSHRDKPLK